MKKRCFLLVIALFFSLLLVYGCGKNGGGGEPTAAELIQQGWTKFSAGNYAGAIADFNAAIGLDATANEYEAYLGLGWAELKLSSGGLAEKAFIKYLAKGPNMNDANAGLALAYDAQDKSENAITKANAVLSSDPTWSFSKDSQINHLDIAYVLAANYCLTANLTQSLAVVKQYFDPNFNADVNTDQGRGELAIKIAEWCQQVF